VEEEGVRGSVYKEEGERVECGGHPQVGGLSRVAAMSSAFDNVKAKYARKKVGITRNYNRFGIVFLLAAGDRYGSKAVRFHLTQISRRVSPNLSYYSLSYVSRPCLPSDRSG